MKTKGTIDEKEQLWICDKAEECEYYNCPHKKLHKKETGLVCNAYCEMIQEQVNCIPYVPEQVNEPKKESVMEEKKEEIEVIRLQVKGYDSRQILCGILADAGYPVWVENKGDSYRADYYVCFETKAVEIAEASNK